jgi:hypothetical protein
MWRDHLSRAGVEGSLVSSQQYLNELWDALWSFGVRGLWSPRLGCHRQNGCTLEPEREQAASGTELFSDKAHLQVPHTLLSLSGIHR